MVLALEGGVCAGKTLVGSRVSSKTGWPLIPEYVEWLQRSGQMLPAGSQLTRLRGYLEAERSRTAMLTGVRPPWILDRSFLTVVAFEFACRQTRREHELTAAVREIDIRHTVTPTCIVYLDCDDTLRAKRLASRQGDAPLPLAEPAFNRALRDFFHEISRFVPIHFVDTSDGDVDTLATSVLRHVAASPDAEEVDLVGGLRTLYDR